MSAANTPDRPPLACYLNRTSRCLVEACQAARRCTRAACGNACTTACREEQRRAEGTGAEAAPTERPGIQQRLL